MFSYTVQSHYSVTHRKPSVKIADPVNSKIGHDSATMFEFAAICTITMLEHQHTQSEDQIDNFSLPSEPRPAVPDGVTRLRDRGCCANALRTTSIVEEGPGLS